MTVTVKRSVTAIALAIVLLASMFGWTAHVKAVMPQYHSSARTVQLAFSGPKFVCPPPPFVCD